MLREDELREAVLLVFANKQDLPNAMSVSGAAQNEGIKSVERSERGEPHLPALWRGGIQVRKCLEINRKSGFPQHRKRMTTSHAPILGVHSGRKK